MLNLIGSNSDGKHLLMLMLIETCGPVINGE